MIIFCFTVDLYPLHAGLYSQLLHRPSGAGDVTGAVRLRRHPARHWDKGEQRKRLHKKNVQSAYLLKYMAVSHNDGALFQPR